MSIIRTPRRLVAAAAGLLTLALPALLGVQGASAGTTGGEHGLRPESFTIQIVNDQDGVINARGPVHGTGTDQESQTSGTSAVFVFPRGTVNVWHSDVSNAPITTTKIKLGHHKRACLATASATGSWKFLGGTGKYHRAFGFGHFTFKLFALVKWIPGMYGKPGMCDVKDQPLYQQINVTAYGLATAGHHHDN
jgi:hypothetical protein